MQDACLPGSEWFQYFCDRVGCSFATKKSQNPLVVSGLIAELDLHWRDKHSAGKESVDSVHKDRMAYEEATKRVTVAEGVDNRSNLLHPMRFAPGVLDCRVAAKMSPLVQTPAYCHPDLFHMGVRIANEKTIRLLHDRSCKTLKLQMFSPQNLAARDNEQKKVTTMEGGRFVEGDRYKDLRDARDALLAVDNYETVYSWLHPQDFGAKAMRRVVVEKYANGNVLSVGPILRFFTAVTYDNANRATRKELPLKYEELLTKWDQCYPAHTSTGGQADVAKLQKEI